MRYGEIDLLFENLENRNCSLKQKLIAFSGWNLYKPSIIAYSPHFGEKIIPLSQLRPEINRVQLNPPQIFSVIRYENAVSGVSGGANEALRPGIDS